jgi:hypothetical protein
VGGRFAREPRTKNPSIETVKRRLAEELKAAETNSANANLILDIT